jgi:CPW-WPC domain-containing protein
MGSQGRVRTMVRTALPVVACTIASAAAGTQQQPLRLPLLTIEGSPPPWPGEDAPPAGRVHQLTPPPPPRRRRQQQPDGQRRMQVQTTIPTLFGYNWVLAEQPPPHATTAGGGLENHAMACNRVGMVPTAREAVFGDGHMWNASTASAVASAIGLGTPVLGGCCASSLWCQNGICVTHHFGGSSYVNYGFFSPSMRPIYTCMPPSYTDLNRCQQNFNVLCPVGWTAQSNGFVCVAPASYGGPCLPTSVLGMYDAGAKQQWATQCGVSWPLVCTPVVTPSISSVSVLANSATGSTIQVRGRGFGDNAADVTVNVGNQRCTNVEVCHTVCRTCSSDADCGTGGICLTVSGVQGSFCSVFCSASYTCPCHTQCHQAYAGNSIRPYYFCLNPGVRYIHDLCGASYAASMGHATGTTSFRCEAPRRPCLAGSNVSVAVRTQKFTAPWFPSLLLNGTGGATCGADADCDDSDSCTIDHCTSFGCCVYQSRPWNQCRTSAEGFKATYPMLNYMPRVELNVTDPRGASWTGQASTIKQGTPTGRKANGRTNTDDYPPEQKSLPFSMPYYDQRLSSIGINSNGVINMGTAWTCLGSVFSSCQVEQLFNVIGLYYADLDLSATVAASVSYNETFIPEPGSGELRRTFVVQFKGVPFLYAPTSHADLSAALELHPAGRIVMRYSTVPTPLVGQTPRVFARSRRGLIPPYGSVGMDFTGVVAATAIHMCPVPKVVCISPVCGPVGGGTVITVTGIFFDHSCLKVGQPASAALHCHFGAVAVVATPVAGSNDTQVECTAPPGTFVGSVRFQLSFGSGNGSAYDAASFLGANSLDNGADVASDPTFKYTASASVCGCSSSGVARLCDVCGVCGGSGACFGCDGNFLSGLVVDACGVCGGHNSTCTGCDGMLLSGGPSCGRTVACISNLTRDDCNVCNGTNADKDCQGICHGSAVIDGCGICSGGNTSLVPNATMDCARVCNGTSLLDHCGTCDTNSVNDCVQDCHSVWGGAAALDSCNICAGGTTGHVPNSTMDCAGICAPLINGVYVLAATLDGCNVCSGGTTSHTANSDKDDCGVCSLVISVQSSGLPRYDHVPHSDKDCNGTCFGNLIVDYCAVCGGKNATLDCNGVCGGPTQPNQCRQCFADHGWGFSVVVSSDPCIQDCNSDWGTNATRATTDMCGTCVGGKTGKLAGVDLDCNGTCFGTAMIDSCSVCSGGNTSHTVDSDKDCNGTCFGNGYIDKCGTCITSAAIPCTQDCHGTWGGSARFDSCRTCAGGLTGLVMDVGADCNGDCFGTASLDSCGECSGGSTGRVPDASKDCAGVCTTPGSRTWHLIDNCGSCVQLGAACSQDCNGVWGGAATNDICGRCSGGATRRAANADMDCFGICFGAAYEDSCNVCSGPVPGTLRGRLGTEVAPDSHRDGCGQW